MFSIHLSELEHTGGATDLRAAHGKTPSISRHETSEVLRAYFASTLATSRQRLLQYATNRRRSSGRRWRSSCTAPMAKPIAASFSAFAELHETA